MLEEGVIVAALPASEDPASLFVHMAFISVGALGNSEETI
jgi:hypothetical protein